MTRLEKIIRLIFIFCAIGILSVCASILVQSSTIENKTLIAILIALALGIIGGNIASGIICFPKPEANINNFDISDDKMDCDLEIEDEFLNYYDTSDDTDLNFNFSSDDLKELQEIIKVLQDHVSNQNKD